jgi:hypothetical protein
MPFRESLSDLRQAGAHTLDIGVRVMEGHSVCGMPEHLLTFCCGEPRLFGECGSGVPQDVSGEPG